jgi:RNA polymerase sigma factor (sigma-70 family)
MPRAPFENVVRYLFQACAMQGDCDLADCDLLERFRVNRDESAFTLLVRRHGPIVFGVCRRLLGNSHEAEDAFQATFLVLVRRIGSIRWRKSIAGWLHDVARRVATKAHTRLAARRHREREARPMQIPQPADQLTTNELRTALDEAIGSLPEKYRTPILLCYLDGKSHDIAAKQLGCSKASISRRVTKACELLRRKLERRGISLTVAALATSLTDMAAAAPLPVLLTIKTVNAATLVAAGKTVGGGGISAGVVALVEEAMAGMVWMKAKLVLIVIGLSLAVGGAGWAVQAGLGEKSQPATTESGAIADKGQPEKEATPLLDPAQPFQKLPDGALARLGSPCFQYEATYSTGQYRPITISPNGKILAVPTYDLGFCLFDANDGQLLRHIRVPLHRGHMVFSADSRTLVTDGLGVIDINTGEVVQSLKSQTNQKIQSIASSQAKLRETSQPF